MYTMYMHERLRLVVCGVLQTTLYYYTNNKLYDIVFNTSS